MPQDIRDIEEFVKAANVNEQFPHAGNATITDLENRTDRKQFKSKHFGRAEKVCCVATSITFVILVVIWIHFELKEDAIWRIKNKNMKYYLRKHLNYSCYPIWKHICFVYFKLKNAQRRLNNYYKETFQEFHARYQVQKQT